MNNKLLMKIILSLVPIFLLCFCVFAMSDASEKIDNNLEVSPKGASQELNWPSEKIIQEKAIAKNKIPVSDYNYLKVWVNAVLKKEWIPADLTDQFILLENLYDESDYFIGRYKKDNNIIQIRIGDGYLWLTIGPSKGLSFYKNKKDFVLAVAKTFINYDNTQHAKMKILSNRYDDNVGGIKIEETNTKGNIQQEYWYEDIVWKITDEYINFKISPPKKIKISGRPIGVKTDWKGRMVISK